MDFEKDLWDRPSFDMNVRPEIAIAAVVAWLTLFTLAVRESAADRRYAEQLHLPG
jgi:hypothetical protein